MSSLKAIDSLLQTINAHEPICNISPEQGIPYEREFSLLLSTLKTRNLYRLNIDHMHSKLQTLLNELPIHTKHNLLNKYYSHSWISHVSYKFHLTPLSIFVTLLKKYVIRKQFKTLWNIIVLLLENGAYPLLTSLPNHSINNNSNISSLQLIWDIFLNLFNFMDDENEILEKVSFVLSFIDKFKFRTFSLKYYQFEITNYYPFICSQLKDTQSHIPSPQFLNVLLQFGYPLFNEYNITFDNTKLYYLSFTKYHQIFFNQKLIDLRSVYCQFEKHKKYKYPILIDGIYDIIIGMTYGKKMIVANDSVYLYNLFSLNSEWIKWSFANIWQYKTDTQLSEMLDILRVDGQFLDEWSGRVRESSNNYSAKFVKFYIKLIQLQSNFNGGDLVLWMKKYENNNEILQLLFKQKYIINKQFVNNKLYKYFWSILCEKDRDSIVLKLLNKHLVAKSGIENKNNFRNNLCLPLFNDFCDKFNGLNWKVRNNLIINMNELLQKWKLNKLELVCTYYGLKYIFNGSSIEIFEQLIDNNLLNVKEIENGIGINSIFDIFEERGKYIQKRHQKIMIEIGKWLINNNNKSKVIQFIDRLIDKCKLISNNALKQKQSLMIKEFKQEWNLQ